MTKSEWERMLQYFEDDEEVSEEAINDYMQARAEELEYLRERREEESLAYAWQDDLIFLHRFER